jgi:hypothetical protein
VGCKLGHADLGPVAPHDGPDDICRQSGAVNPASLVDRPRGDPVAGARRGITSCPGEGPCRLAFVEGLAAGVDLLGDLKQKREKEFRTEALRRTGGSRVSSLTLTYVFLLDKSGNRPIAIFHFA